MRALILCCLILLSGCTHLPEIQVYHSQPPEELLTCNQAPEPPANDSVDAYRGWSVKMYYAWLSCYEQLGRVRNYLDQQATQHLIDR